jgi:glucan phosphoethanolaminetransferase (alkaline phosphatase superfamily)
LIRLGGDVLVIQQLVAILVVVALVAASLLEVTRFTKLLLSILLVVVAILHYIIIIKLLGYVDVVIYPLFIVEKAFIQSIEAREGALYIDLGQVSIISLAIIWRKEVARLIKRALHHEYHELKTADKTQ